MLNSTFWQDLALQFRALPGKYGDLKGERTLTVGEPIGEWHLRGSRTARVEFEALARRGAMHIPNPRSDDLLTAWLEDLADDEKGTGTIYGTSRERNGPTIHTVHTLFNLPERSANYCKVLESVALEYEAVVRPVAFAPQLPLPKSNLVEKQTIQSQLHKLRTECKWSVEDLAKKTGLDERTIRRHLSGKTRPHLRNIGVYEQAFSKALKKKWL